MYARRALTSATNGILIVTGDDRGTVHVRTAATGDLVKMMDAHSKFVNAIAFSPDGRLLATCGDDSTVRLWNCINWDGRSLRGHKGSVVSLAFSPSGHLLATGGQADNTVRVWDTASGDCLRKLKGHVLWVRTVSFSRDGSMLTTASADGTVLDWDCQTWQEISPPPQKGSLGAFGGPVRTRSGSAVEEVDGMRLSTESVPRSPQHNTLSLSGVGAAGSLSTSAATSLTSSASGSTTASTSTPGLPAVADDPLKAALDKWIRIREELQSDLSDLHLDFMGKSA